MKWTLDDIDIQILRVVAGHHGITISEICREVVDIKFSTCRARINILLEGKFLRARRESRAKIIFFTEKAKRALQRGNRTLAVAKFRPSFEQ